MSENLDIRPELVFLKKISREEITPYDENFFQRDPNYHSFITHSQVIFSKIKSAVNDMSVGMFKWEEEIMPNSWEEDLILICKFYNSLPDKQMVDLIDIPGFNENITPDTIRILIESVQELFECPERLCNLDLISQVFELWMRNSFMQFINYMPRIDSKHIQLMDPLMRSKIRETNRKDKDFEDKFVKNFDIKKFIFLNLEKLFECNKARALGGGLRRMRLNMLKMTRYMFEIGLWRTKDLPRLMDLLHSKLQLLFAEEHEFGDDFRPHEHEKGSAYDPFYHENIAAIINHTTILKTDELYKIAMNDTTDGTITPVGKIKDLIQRFYFVKKEDFNKVQFLFFDGILYSVKDVYNEDGSLNEKEVYSSRTTFMNLFDINNDLFVLSTNNINEETIANYEAIAKSAKSANNNEFARLDQVKKELKNVLQDMRDGKVFLDPNVAFKNDNGEEKLIDPSKMKGQENMSQAGSDTSNLPKSSLASIKGCFEDLLNDSWFINLNNKKNLGM